jgi:hypothetical protein
MFCQVYFKIMGYKERAGLESKTPSAESYTVEIGFCGLLSIWVVWIGYGVFIAPKSTSGSPGADLGVIALFVLANIVFAAILIFGAFSAASKAYDETQDGE